MPNDPRIPPTARLVEILAFPSANLLDVAGPLQVFASANEASRNGPSATYDISLISKKSPVTTSAGIALVAHRLPDMAKPVDTLIIAGGGGVHAACKDRALLDWLAARARVAGRVASVCTGAFLLGAAGLLDGKRAVTHWADCAALTRLFPQTRVDMNAIFIRDGDLWSS